MKPWKSVPTKSGDSTTEPGPFSCNMFPAADTPVVQLSLDRNKLNAHIITILRNSWRTCAKQGVLIVGSGNIVHNLRTHAVFEDRHYDWAIEFDETVKGWIVSGDHESIINYPRLGPTARLAIPTNEHYLPLLYVLALQEPGEHVRFFNEQVTLGSISMRSLRTS